MTQSTIMTAIFANPQQASAAWNALERGGFDGDRLSWMMSREVYETQRDEGGNGRAEKVTKGAFSGAVSGTAMSLLTVFSVAAGGPIAALAAAGIGAAGGGLLGSLVGAGLPHRSATRIVEAIPDGGVVLAVDARHDDELSQARTILERHGARHRHEIPQEPRSSAQA